MEKKKKIITNLRLLLSLPTCNDFTYIGIYLVSRNNFIFLSYVKKINYMSLYVIFATKSSFLVLLPNISNILKNHLKHVVTKHVMTFQKQHFWQKLIGKSSIFNRNSKQALSQFRLMWWKMTLGSFIHKIPLIVNYFVFLGSLLKSMKQEMLFGVKR